MWCEGEAIQKLKTSIVMAASSHLTDSHSTVSLPTSETVPSENSCTDINQSQSECAHPKNTDVDLGPDVPSHNTLLTLADQLQPSSKLLGVFPTVWIIDQRNSSWVLFAIQFGIAVLVVVCPCGEQVKLPSECSFLD